MIQNRRCLLARRPRGALALDDFELRTESMPEPSLAPGQILLRNQLFVCAATMRNWLNEPGRSHRTIDVGAPIRGAGGSQVVASNHAGYPVGARVTWLAPWEDYTVVAPDTLRGPMTLQPPEVALVDALGIFGMNSFTAYFGLLRAGEPRAGETVVVSAAAGSVGSMVVQIAKVIGCRVVGIAGGRDKCGFVVGELGADAVIDYKNEDVRARLAELCPQGVDVYFDNVGGDILDAVVDAMAMKGRIALCGQVASYDGAPGPSGLRDLMKVIYRSLTLRGFTMNEHLGESEIARTDIARWLGEGKLARRDDVRHGFENLPSAFIGLFTGESRGTLMVDTTTRDGS